MQIFESLITNICKSKNFLGSLGDTLDTFNESASVNYSFIEPIQRYRDILQGTSSSYDALILGIEAADDSLGKIPELMAKSDFKISAIQDYVSDITEKVTYQASEFEQSGILKLVSGFDQCYCEQTGATPLSEIEDLSGNQTGEDMSITLSGGRIITFRRSRIHSPRPSTNVTISYEIKNFDNGQYPIDNRPLVLHFSDGENLSSVDFKPNFRYSNPENVEDTQADNTTCWALVAQEIAAAGEINDGLLTLCNGVLTGRLVSVVDDFRVKISTANKAMKTFYSSAVSSWSNGGFRGIVSFILDYLRGTQSATDSNGILIFTDNNKLRPQEFIAGIIAGAVSSALTVAGLIVAAFSKTAGMLIAAVGSLAQTIAQRVIATHDDTFAVINDGNSFDDDNTYPIFPFACTATTVATVPDWYLMKYNSGEPLVLIPFICGYFLAGPGSFSPDGKTVTSLRLEFHPIFKIFKSYAFYNLCHSIITYGKSGSLTEWPAIEFNKVANIGYNGLITEYHRIVNNYTPVSIGNSSSGKLDQSTDNLVRLNLVWYITILYLYLCLVDSRQNTWSINYLYHQDNRMIMSFHNVGDITPLDRLLICAAESADVLEDESYDVWAGLLAWDRFIDIANDMKTQESYHAYTASTDGDDNTTFTYYGTCDAPYQTVVQNIAAGAWYGSLISVRSDFKYIITPPKYNARTYWLWVTAAAVITAVATATVAVCAVKFHKWRTRKRAENVAKFNQAQSEYQSAMKGERQELIDGEYQTVQFDVNSPEGKQYIASMYSNYRWRAIKNNCWANIIGGSKYDIGSFWGEASASETSRSLKDRLSGLFEKGDSDVSFNADSVLNLLHRDITGQDL